MDKLKKILYAEGKFFAWKAGDVHTSFGMMKEADLAKVKEKITSNTGVEFQVFPPKFNDYLARMKRGPQIITPKDVGLILAYTNIDKDAFVVEAGTGSGALTWHLARYVKKVVSYEQREEFYKIAKANLDFFGYKNVTLKFENVEEGLDEKEVDLVVFDLADPWKLVEKAHTALKQGCYCVAYLPSITQMMYFVNKAREKFYVERVVEVLERQWHVEEKRVRPHSAMIAHTGFLCFARKL